MDRRIVSIIISSFEKKTLVSLQRNFKCFSKALFHSIDYLVVYMRSYYYNDNTSPIDISWNFLTVLL